MKKNFTKAVSLLMAIVMIFALAACGAKEEPKAPEVNIADALELMNTVWAGYADADKFPAAGGDFTEENGVMDGPGKFDVTDAEFAMTMFCLPADCAGMVDDGASLFHMMNTNTFTGAAFRVKNADDTAKLAEKVRDAIKGNQWMCGIPDKLAVMAVGNYIVYAFGAEELVDTFKAKTASAYDMTQTLFDESVL